MSEIISKRCTKCGETKSFSDFTKDKSKKSGYCSWCKECHSELSAKWNRLHPEKVKESLRKWLSENIEKRRQYSREKQKQYGYKPNPEIHRKWKRNHPEKISQYNRNRRASRKGSEGNISADEWNNVVSRYGNKCLCCGATNIKLTLDHVIPLSTGGTHTIDNVQPLCTSCNSRKRDRQIDYRPF